MKITSKAVILLLSLSYIISIDNQSLNLVDIDVKEDLLMNMSKEFEREEFSSQPAIKTTKKGIFVKKDDRLLVSEEEETDEDTVKDNDNYNGNQENEEEIEVADETIQYKEENILENIKESIFYNRVSMIVLSLTYTIVTILIFAMTYNYK